MSKLFKSNFICSNSVRGPIAETFHIHAILMLVFFRLDTHPFLDPSGHETLWVRINKKEENKTFFF
jgi:hypothetical protein